MSHETNWIPGLIVLAVAAVGALAFLLFGRHGAPVTGGSGDDLDARYDALLRQLKEHLANEHLLPQDAFQAERARLEQAAAGVLKQKAGVKHEETKSAARKAKLAVAQAEGPLAKHPALRGALIGGVVVAFFAVLGWQLSESSEVRKEEPGMGPPMAGQPPQEDLQLRAVMEAVRRSPEDVEALSTASLYLLRVQGFDDARPFVLQAQRIDPYAPRVRISAAVLEAVDGRVPQALAQLEHLATAYPEAYEAQFFAGLISLEQNDNARALQNLEAYVVMAPPAEHPPGLRQAVQQLRMQVEQGLRTP